MLPRLTRLLLLVLPLGAGCAGTRSLPEDNFDLCLREQRGCRMDQLEAAQRAMIERRAAAEHLRDCMNRMRCNEKLLSPPEVEQVRTSVLRLNHGACLRGEVECDEGLLDEAQREEVARAFSQRNLENCLGGLTLCASSLLSEEEAQAVHDAYLERNFSGCMNTVGTLVECNEQDLTAEQVAAVRRRNSAVNAYLCATGAFGCDPDLPGVEERDRPGPTGTMVR